MTKCPVIKPLTGGYPAFLATWLGQVVSLVGSGLSTFSLDIWVFQRTGSPTQFALIGLFAVLPKVVFSPIAGVLVDRFDRRRIMIIADAGAGLSTLFIASMLFSDRLEIWHIYLSAALTAFCGTFQWPAYTATVPLLVPEKQLGRANGMNQLGRAAAEIFSPLLAGVLVLTIQLEGVILLDMFTFLFAMFTLSFVRFPHLKNKPVLGDLTGFTKDLTFGWRYILARQGLVNLLIFQVAVNFIWGLLGALIVPMIMHFTTSDRLGAVITIAGVGMLTGSLIMTARGGPKQRVNGIIFFELLSGVCFMLMGLRPQFWMVAAGAFGAHITIAIVFGTNQALWQYKVELQNQGRVFAAQQMFASLAAPLAYLVAGPLAEKIFEPWMASHNMLSFLLTSGPGRGIGLMFILMGAVKILVSLFTFLNPRVRLIEDELPDALPIHN